MILRIISRIIAKGESLYTTVMNSDSSFPRHDVKRRKPVPADDTPSHTKFPSKMKKLIHSNKFMKFVTCLVIIIIPTSCIFFGLGISNHLAPMPHFFSDMEVVVDVTMLNYTWYNTRNVTIRFVGGLGNQMFQYASLVGIAKANGLKPVIDGKHNKLRAVFQNLGCRVENEENELKRLRSGSGFLTFLERKSNAYENRAFSLNFMKDIQLAGFFQSWRYFDHVRSEIKKQFSSFRPSVEMKVEDFLHSILKAHSMMGEDLLRMKFVGIHVRRGDFLEKSNVERGYSVADAYFYKRAMQFFIGKFKHVIFIVCSDDPEWASDHLRSTGHGSLVIHSKFSNMSDPAYDLKLLSSCNHTIISGSTFGWWGAWLSGGVVAYNREFPKPESLLATQFRMSDYYMPQWIPI